MKPSDKPKRPYLNPTEYEMLEPFIKRFESNVWFPKLFEQVNATTCRGQSGKAGDKSILLWTCAGRTMITIRDAQGSWMSLMVAEDSKEPTMGLHETAIDICQMVSWMRDVEQFWEGVRDCDSVTLDILAR